MWLASRPWKVEPEAVCTAGSLLRLESIQLWPRGLYTVGNEAGIVRAE